MARRHRTSQKFQNSLMPFCRKCPPAQYQPDFNQNKCLQCPLGMKSPRGAISIDNCDEEKRHICEINSAICGPHGICVPENENQHLYSCLCEDGFTGSVFLFFLFVSFKFVIFCIFIISIFHSHSIKSVHNKSPFNRLSLRVSIEFVRFSTVS